MSTTVLLVVVAVAALLLLHARAEASAVPHEAVAHAPSIPSMGALIGLSDAAASLFTSQPPASATVLVQAAGPAVESQRGRGHF